MPEWLQLDDLLISVSAAAVVVFGARLVPRLIAGVPFIAPKAAHANLTAGEDVLVLDVREAREFTDNLGHIKGALNLPLGQINEALKDNSSALDAYKETQIYVVCRSANRAASAARALKKAGMTKVSVVTGGMMKWKRDGLPSVR